MKRTLCFLAVILLLAVSVAGIAQADENTERIGHVSMLRQNTAIEYLYRTFIQIPVGMAYGPDGNMYVADWAGHHIVKIDPDNNVTDLGLWKTTDAFRWDGPRGLAFDSEGSLYISNHGHLYRLDTEGTFKELRGVQGSPIGSIAVSPSDELYYTDRGQGRVLKWTSDNGAQVIASGIPNAENLVFGPDGTLYLTQMNHPDLLKMDVGTGQWEVFVKNVCGNDPCYLAVDHEGDIWIRALSTLYQYSPDGKKKSFTINKKSSDQFIWHTSAGIAVDSEGGVCIASYNSRISRLIPTKPGAKDPKFTLAVAFTGMEASDLAVDSNGNVYATDLNGRQVLKIDPDGKAETFIDSGSAARHAVTVDADDCVYYTTDKGEIRRVDQAGKNARYASLKTESMVFGADGILYAVKIGSKGVKSIVGISKKDKVFTLASKIAGDSLGSGDVRISPATDGGLYVFSQSSRNLYLLDFDGEGQLIGNYSNLGGGVFCMAANPANGEVYLIPHGSYIMYAVAPDGSYREMAQRFFGDPWSMVVSGDGASIYVAESGAIYKITQK